MIIKFGQDLELTFEIESGPIAALWQDKMRVRHQWPLDDPKRFYNFGTIDQSRQWATQRLLHCIQIINDYEPIIKKQFTSIEDQDLLNYLHNIFERYHGLLDQQNTAWWHAAPAAVQKSLADLNIAVHRAESAIRGGNPRFVCTWFGMPKNTELSKEIIESYGRLTYEFGGVYLNYVEIGKTLEDLSTDNDQWIGDDAFQPFRHYSADFNVRFYDSILDTARIFRYFEDHKDFFQARGINQWDDYRTKPYRFKVAQLATDLPRAEILRKVSEHQEITDIYLP